MEGTALVEPPAAHAHDAPVVVVVQGDSLAALFSDAAPAPLPMRTHHLPATPEEEKVNSPYRFGAPPFIDALAPVSRSTHHFASQEDAPLLRCAHTPQTPRRSSFQHSATSARMRQGQ